MHYKYKIDNSPCAPAVDENGKFKTCYSKESLIKISNELSKKNKLAFKTNYKSKKQLWDFIQKQFQDTCSKKEQCWVKRDEVKNLKNIEINRYTFKPEYPTNWKNNKHTWLNTYDILKVMKQYEKKYPDFKFMGVVPSDCPTKIHCELSNMDIQKMKKNNIHHIGLIYNLDTSSGPGTHWVAMFIDNKNNEINYYDSYGSMPIKLIQDFISKLKINFKKNNYEPTVIYNNKRHQYGGSECGMYSMNFILERLNGVNMYQISKRNISDEDMNKLRDFLYSKNKMIK